VPDFGPSGGHDTVESSIDGAGGYTLTSNVENLVLSGGAYAGYGNELDNHITGTSDSNFLGGGLGDDTLDGGAGSDQMVGGYGNDTYIVDTSGDSVYENDSPPGTGGHDVVESA